MSVKDRTIIHKYTEPDEDREIKFDPIVKLASHEDTFNRGELLPVKCRKDEYETIEKIIKGKNSVSSSYCYERSKYHIAVKELIILWDDYQIETAGFIGCSSCENFIKSSVWASETSFEGDNENCARVSTVAFNTIIIDKHIKLLQFIKPPGQKMTYMKIPDSELYFLPIDLKKSQSTVVKEFGFVNINVNSMQRGHSGTLTRREHQISCTIKSLFDANEVLPIKKAHLTVEIIIKQP